MNARRWVARLAGAAMPGARVLLAAGLTFAATSVGPAAAGTSAAATTGGVITIDDDTGLLRLDVPSNWTDVATAPRVNPDGTNDARIAAAPDLQGLSDTYTTPGVIYSAIDYNEDTAGAVTAAYDFTGICRDAGVEAYSDSYFVGSTQTWTGCDGTASRIVTLAVNPLDRSFTATLLIQIPTAADEASLQTILDSFYVVVPTTTQLRDDTGTITVSVPASWTDINTGPQSSGGTTYPSIAASTDLADGTYQEPAMLYAALPFAGDLAATMASNTFADCAPGQVTEYSDGYFTGLIQEQTACLGTPSRHVTVVANPPDRAFTAVLFITLPTPADDVSLHIVLDSFYIGEGQPDAVSVP